MEIYLFAHPKFLVWISSWKPSFLHTPNFLVAHPLGDLHTCTPIISKAVHYVYQNGKSMVINYFLAVSQHKSVAD